MEDKEEGKEENKEGNNNKEKTDNENNKNKNDTSKKFEMTEEQKKALMETFKKMSLARKAREVGGYDDVIKPEYKFWGTQPVPQFNEECKTEFGEIWKDHKVEDLDKEPLTLPEGYEWKDVDLSKQVEMEIF